MKNRVRPIRRNKNTRTNQPEFRALEPRQLLAGISHDSLTGVISVEGSQLADSVLVSELSTSITVTLSGYGSRSFQQSEVTEVLFIAKEGDDWFRNDTSIRARVFGQLGNDTLIGGTSADVLNGGPGNDSIRGNDGNDILIGFTGDDFLTGGSGNDWINGNQGNDDLRGEDDSDTLIGEIGDDYLDGGSGNDRAFGSSGNDTIFGRTGNDILAGQDGNDRIFGGDGDDYIYGNTGDDTLSGEAGDDNLSGNDGLDRVFGGIGNDLLIGGLDDDILAGDAGEDQVYGSGGDDKMYGGDDADRIFGNLGNDDLFGGRGDDFMRGNGGIDRIYGQSESDDMDGGEDNDDLNGGSGRDRMRGGPGNDDYFSDSSDDLYDDSDDYAADGDFEIRGAISSLDTDAKTFSILGFTVNYASARVEGLLADGAFFKAEGTFVEGELVAHEVESKHPDETQDNFEARGTVSVLDISTGTFQLNGLTVNFGNAEVSGTLQDGIAVKVEGTLSDGVVIAREVKTGTGEDQNHGSSNFELRGAISALDTTNRTFSLLGVLVDYSNSEVVGQLANGLFIKAEGFHDGTKLMADEIEPEEDEDRDENIEIVGEVTNLDISARTFQILGFTVSYANAEVINPIGNGVIMEVEGWFANSTIDAEKIR